MDSTKTVTCLEWFFGYGGNHLGLARVIPGLRVLAACEIEAYAVANLVAKMEAGLLDPFPVWTDCKTFPCEMFRGRVDLFVASYPCQGFSAAGQRKGQSDPRFLWPWVLRAIVLIQPRRIFLENVEGHVSLGLSTVISDVEAAGYRHEEGLFSAVERGAPQQRKRVFILGELACNQGERWGQGRPKPAGEQRRFNVAECSDGDLAVSKHMPIGTEQQLEPGQRSHEESQQNAMSRRVGEMADAPQFGCEHTGSARGRRNRPANHGGTRELDQPTCSRCGKIHREPAGKSPEHASRPSASSCTAGVGQADACGARCQGSERPGTHEQGPAAPGSVTQCRPLFWPAFVTRPGEFQHGWEPPRVIKTLGGLGGGVNGRAANVDRLRLLGNGVYPAAAARAWVVLNQRLHHRK